MRSEPRTRYLMSAQLGFFVRSEPRTRDLMTSQHGFFVRSEPRTRHFSAENSEKLKIRKIHRFVCIPSNTPSDVEYPSTQSFSSKTRFLEIVTKKDKKQQKRNLVSVRAVSQTSHLFLLTLRASPNLPLRPPRAQRFGTHPSTRVEHLVRIHY